MSDYIWFDILSESNHTNAATTSNGSQKQSMRTVQNPPNTQNN